MRKLLFLFPLLVLASCAPILSAVQGDTGTFTRDGASVVLTNPAGGGKMLDAAVRVEGLGLVMGAPCALRAVNVYGCVLGDVPDGKSYRLTPTAGLISKASATYYPDAGVRFIYLELP